MRINPIEFITTEEELYNSRVKQIYSRRGNLITINTADLHFGAIDPEYQYRILKEQQLNILENILFDIFIISGDLLDHKFMSNSDAIRYFLQYISDVVALCKKKNASILILSGTKEHDAGQLKLLYHYMEDKTIDFRIVEKTKFEYIKNAKILCIPEEYNMGKEYYNYFLHKCGEYDMCTLHGALQGSIYGTNVPDLNTIRNPIFCIEDFDLCRGPIFAGHVHTPGCFNTYFYYCGNPYRWQFGEEEDKGFFIVLHNLDNNSHYAHFQIIQSKKYMTIDMSNLMDFTPQDMIHFVSEYTKENNIDYIRLKFPDNPTQDSLSTIDIIKKYYKNNTTVKVKLGNLDKKDILNENKEVLNKYKDLNFILDKNLSGEEILTRYINYKEDCQFITVNELIELLKE